MKKYRLFLFTIFLSLVLISCTKEEDEPETTLTVPSEFEFSNVLVSGGTYMFTQGGNYEAVSTQEFNENVPWFEGFMYEDLIDTFQSSFRPVIKIHFVSDLKADVFGIGVSSQKFDLPGLDYTVDGANILIDQDFETDRFILHLEMINSSTIQINTYAFQIRKDEVTRPVEIDQIPEVHSLEEAAQHIRDVNELAEGDYFYVIHGAYSYTKS